jgi:outer membrane protein TolC
MAVKDLVISFLLVCIAGLPATARGQEIGTESLDADAPLLTLEQAVSIAVANNRMVKDSVLEAKKYEFRVSMAKTKRLPSFQLGVLSGELLHSFDFNFPAGSFGTYGSAGPIPATDSTITTPATVTTFITGSVDMPLLQQHKIGLSIRATEVGHNIALEGVDAQRQKIAADVRSAYFNLIATQAAADAARQAVQTLVEAQRVTAQYQVQQVVLRAEALEVDSRLERTRYDLSVADNELATQRERLNQLLGRDLTTPFRVHALLPADDVDLTLAAARQHAAQYRPEIRQAQLKESQADLDRRLARAEYIPDLSLSVRYFGFNNYEVLPSNVTVAGLFLTWEPFDWGRRRSNTAEKATALEQARNASRETEAQVLVEVAAKYRKWQDARLLMNATRLGHEAAVEQLRVTSNRYQQQAVLIRDLLQAVSHSADATYQYQQSLSAYWTTLADLHRAMGEE